LRGRYGLVYEQVYEPVAGSLALSALVAAIPILVLFVLLAGVRVAPRTGPPS
jgi:lactate permease